MKAYYSKNNEGEMLIFPYQFNLIKMPHKNSWAYEMNDDADYLEETVLGIRENREQFIRRIQEGLIMVAEIPDKYVQDLMRTHNSHFEFKKKEKMIAKLTETFALVYEQMRGKEK